MDIFIACLVSFVVAYISFLITGWFSKSKIDGILNIVRDQDPELGQQQYMFLELNPESVPKIKKGSRLYFEVEIVDKTAK